MKFFIPVFTLLVLLGCSSTPRRPAENLSQRNIAYSQLNMANQAANQGRYDDAFIFLSEARRIALSTDDPVLRLETSMTRANILFSMGNAEDAFREWAAASAEGITSGQNELAALARVFSIRASLTLLGNNDTINSNMVQDYRAALEREIPSFGRNSHSLAQLNLTIGLAEKLLGNWTEAENAVRRGLTILERGNFLEDTAYAWFLIGSIRSQAGNYESALEALDRSIGFDRRAENSFGLASSWQAVGDVQSRAGRPAESRAAWYRAAEIFRAIGLDHRAEILEVRINE